jgi:hypothetical protein
MSRDPLDDLGSLGFEGLLTAGLTPAEAWAEIHDSLTAAPEALAIIDGLADTAEGRDALAWSRERWARHGLRPPWEAEP